MVNNEKEAARLRSTMRRLYPVESKLGTPEPSAASDRVERKRSNRANHDEMLLAEALKRFSLEIWVEAREWVHMLRSFSAICR